MRNFFKKNRTILIILLILVVGVSAFLFVRRSNADTTSQYQTATVARGNLTATIGATGTVRAKQTAMLIWQAAGTVDTVNVKVGDNIPANFVMAYLQKTSLPQSVIMAEADLASSQKDLDDLLNSDTALAQAAVSLRDAQDAYDKSQNYYDSLFRPYKYYKISYKYIYLPGKTKRIPILKKVRVDKADDETIANSEQDLALAKANWMTPSENMIFWRLGTSRNRRGTGPCGCGSSDPQPGACDLAFLRHCNGILSIARGSDCCGSDGFPPG